jgi:exosortase/archaeosortase family protein
MTLEQARRSLRLASRPVFPSTVARPDLFAVVAAVAAVDGFAGKISTSFYRQPLLLTILDLGGVSAIVWFAIGSLFSIAHEAQIPTAPQRRDKIVAALVMILSFVPLNFAAAIGLLLNGLYLALTSPGRGVERRMAAVMIGLTGPLIWGRFLLALMGPALLGLDAKLAGFLANEPVHSNVVGLHGGGNLYVALGCSSVHNMSLAILLFVTLTQMMRLRYTRLMVMTGVLAALAMAVVNVLRLAALARFPQIFDLLHTGWGGSLFGALSLVVAGAIIAGGIRVERPR